MSLIIDKFAILGNDMFALLTYDRAVFTLMFFAMLMGTFAMFKSLLTFVFKKQEGFNTKAINVMAFMLSFIGTTGIAFMYSSSPKTFIYVFGGGFGYFLVLFLVIFIFRIMHMFGEDTKDEKGMLGKGAVYIFFMILAALLSAYLLLGYTGKILEGLGCTINTTTNDAVCGSNDGTFLYAKTYNVIAGLIAFLVPFAVMFGIWMLIKHFNKNAEDGHGEHGGHDDPFAHDDKHDQEHAEHVSHLIHDFNHNMHDAANVFQEQSNSLGRLQDILNNRGGGH